MCAQRIFFWVQMLCAGSTCAHSHRRTSAQLLLVHACTHEYHFRRRARFGQR